MKSCAAFMALSVLASASATTYTIDPSKESGEGGDFEVDCLLLVEPGDSCYLLDGDHKHDGLTRVHGTKDKPITIYGESDKACIKGSNTQDRALQIAHSHYIVRDLCFDGKHDKDYVSTAVYVLGADNASTDEDGVKSSVTGFQMYNNIVKNWDEECIHLRYFVVHSAIYGNLIQNCGMHCFGDRDEDDYCSVGEGVYVGTALDQVKDGKTPEVKLRSGSADKPSADVCQYNWIHSNDIFTYGNECVDIKEGSQYNVVEHNNCMHQRDDNSGCMGTRGSNNCFRHNNIDTCRGAGVRTGGDKGYGGGNCVCDNVIKNCEYGAFNIMTNEQGPICGNDLSGIDVVSQGVYKADVDTTSATADCADKGCCDHCCIAYFPDTCDSSGTTRSSGSASADDDSNGDDGGNASGDDGGNASGDDGGNSSGDDGGNASDDDGGNATPLEEEEEEEEFGQNHADEGETVSGIFTIDTNSLAGGGLGNDDWDDGKCKNIVKVSKMKVEHVDDRDTTTSHNDLFDGVVSLESYFSVNRFMTSLVMELDEETEIDGIALGFFMKQEDEERIQTFDVSIRSYDEEEYTTVIATKESSGKYMDMQHFDFTSEHKARYVKLSSKGNNFNNWTAFTEIAVCGYEAEENALFGGLRTAKDKITELATNTNEVCNACSVCSTTCDKLVPKKAHVTNPEGDIVHVHELFDGDYHTRWFTDVTSATNDLDNGKITITFDGDRSICGLSIAMFDGHLAHQHIGIKVQAAADTEWHTAGDEIDVEMKKTDALQYIHLSEFRVTKLYIVGHGNDVGDFNKVSELQIFGC